MRQERHRGHPRIVYLEEFRTLLNSDYWQCLSEITKESILTMLAEYRGEFIEDRGGRV